MADSPTMKLMDDIQNDDKKAQEILAEKLGAPVVPENTVATDEDDIEKVVGHKDWTFEAEYDINFRGEMKTQTFKRAYIQKPLSYHAFGEFTGLLGRKLAEAMRGPDGLSLDRLTPGEASIPLQFSDGQISLAGGDNDNLIDPIVQGIAKLATYVPDLM